MMAWSPSNERTAFDAPANRRTIAHSTVILVEGLSTGLGFTRGRRKYIICTSSVSDGARQVNQPELISNHRIGIGGSFSKPVPPTTG